MLGTLLLQPPNAGARVPPTSGTRASALVLTGLTSARSGRWAGAVVMKASGEGRQWTGMRRCLGPTGPARRALAAAARAPHSPQAAQPCAGVRASRGAREAGNSASWSGRTAEPWARAHPPRRARAPPPARRARGRARAVGKPGAAQGPGSADNTRARAGAGPPQPTTKSQDR